MNVNELAEKFLSDTQPDFLTPPPSQGVSDVNRMAEKFLEGPSTGKPSVTPLVTFDGEGRPVLSETGYTQNDLVQDRFYKVIEDYMTTRFGSQSVEDEREEVVNKFLNNMRGFAGGNSVRAVSEISFLNSADNEEETQAAAKAYALYEGMEGFFGNVSGKERFEIAKDFIGSAVLDPVNLMSLGIGKVASSGGLRLATQTAQAAARKTFAQRIAAGATRQEALEVAGRVMAAQARQEGVSQSQGIATRQAIREAATSSVRNRLLNSSALREIAAVGAFDGAASAATDYLYQDAMLRTKVQEEYSEVQTGIAALASVVMMGAVAGIGQFRVRSGMTGPDQLKFDPEGVDLSEMSNSIRRYLDSLNEGNPNLPEGAPPKTITSSTGIELEAADSKFFTTMVLGNDEMGIKGLSQLLEEQGYGWVKRDADDRITFFLADVIANADPQDFSKVLKDYTEYTGIQIKELESVTPERFAQVFRDKLSNEAGLMQALGTAAKRLGLDSAEKVTLEDYLEFSITGRAPQRGLTASERAARRGTGILQRLGIPEGTVSAVQNRLIRLLVSNLSTTSLNVTGFAAASTMNTISDVSIGVLNAGGKTLQSFVGKSTLADAGKEITDALATTQFKLANTLDPGTTLDMFKQYALRRPQPVRELMRVLPGGVENIEKITDAFDPNATVLGEVSDRFIDVVQSFNLVTAQDSYTKSIEFLTQMDKRLRRQYGMGYTEFFQSPDYKLEMASREFKLLEAAAVDDTLSTIFSKSYKDPGTPLGELAGFIEDARNLPGIGMLVPFGRFFNNTIAFMADNSGLSLIGRVFKEPKASTYTNKELFVRGAVSITAVYAMAQREYEFIDKGLAWAEEFSFTNTGSVIDETYEFPYAAYKAAARILAHHMRGEELPGELAKEVTDTFLGQFTRNLDASGQSAIDMVETFLSADGKEIMDVFQGVVGKIASQSISAGTRFIDPVNTAVGLAMGDDYVNPDLKQGATVVREATRYMNHIIQAFGGEYEEKMSPTEGRIQSPAGRYVGTVREVEMTDLNRVYNMMGIPPYKAGSMVQDAPTKNRYAELFDLLNQSTATALLNNPKFMEGDQEYRKFIWSDFMEKNRRRVKEYMAAGYDTNDLKSRIILEVDDNSTEKELSKAQEKLGLEGDLSDLSYESLNTLLQYLKFRGEFLKGDAFK